MRTLLRKTPVLWLCPVVWSANIPITVVGTTETQIDINYTAPGSAACSIAATDNNGGPAVNDLDAAKFAHANSDLGRTAANGFRWPTLVNDSNPLNRTVFIGGHDEVKLGVDHKWYSTALQVNSDHTITVTCGSDSGTVHASTRNLPVASTYPEQVIPAENAPMGGFPQPSRQWNLRRNEKLIDPITGMLFIGVSGPLDAYRGTVGLQQFSYAHTKFSYAYDRLSAWKNKDNAFTARSGSTLATTSTENAPLFLATNQADFGWYTQQDLSDIQVFPFGNSTGSPATVGHCLSMDSGQTCMSHELTQTFSTGSPHLQGSGIPSTAFSGMFSAWAPLAPNAMIGNFDLTNSSYNGGGGHNVVNASGSVVTLTNRNGAGFALRAPGSKLQLTSCATGADVELTVARSDNPEHITVQETGLNHTNCTYQDRAFGLRVELKSPGTVHLSETLLGLIVSADNRRTNGSEYMCAPSKVKDIHTGVDGTTYPTPMSGYLCAIPTNNSGLIVLIQDDGKVGLQSVMSPRGDHNNGRFSLPASPWVDAKTLLTTQLGSGHVLRITKDNSGNYTEYVPGTTIPDDRFSYYDVTANTSTPILKQVQNAGGNCADALSKGLVKLGNLQTVAGGYLYYYIGAGASDTHGGYAFFDGSNNYIGCMLGWDTYPMRNGAMHQSPESVGKYVVANMGNLFANYDPNNQLGGPFVLQPSAFRKNGKWVSYNIPIASATNANPVVLVSANHDLDNWQGYKHPPFALPWITCSGATGPWSALNGTFRLSKVDKNSFSLKDTSGKDIDSTSWGALAGSVTCSVTQPLFDAQITRIAANPSDNNAARVTLGAPQGYSAYFPSNSPHVQNGDSVVLDTPDTKAYYVKVSCSGCSQTSFDLYSDPGLTTPVSAAAISRAGSIANAEACPALSTLKLPGPIIFDPSGGPGESPTHIRCVTYEYAGEPCSYWAGAAESRAYPCASNPQPHTSSLQAIQPGDVLFDVSHAGANHERFLVLKKDTSSHAGFVRLTLLRWYGETVHPSSKHSGPTVDWWGYQHSPGWTPMTAATNALALIDASNPTSWLPMPPPYVFSHVDIATMSTPGYGVTIPSWQKGNLDGVFNRPINEIASAAITKTHDNTPLWNGTDAYSLNGPSQSYPTARHEIYATGEEQNWAGDWAAMNIASGNGINQVDGSGVPLTLTPVPGTQNVFVINNASGTTAIKTQPYLAIAPGYLDARDISSPATGNIITDATPNTICYAKNANECRAGSSPGTWFLSMYGAWNCCKQYLTNQFTYPVPVLFGPAPWAGWAMQFRQNPIDKTGTGVRRITQGFALPGTHLCFQNWRSGPPAPGGGVWGFFATNPWRGRLRYRELAGTGWLLGKVPPWPAPDPEVRTTYVRAPIRVKGRAGDSVRIAFGYGENGDAASLYCTSRRETCWTAANPTAKDPFVYAGETQASTPCDRGCTVNIPAIPGRVVFYRIETTNSGAATTGPLQALPVP